MPTASTSFHPDELIPLVHAQHPDRRDVIRALQLCNTGYWESPAYFYFVNRNAGKPGAEWQFRENLELSTKDQGRVVLHVLQDGRIGRIEFV